MSHFAENAVPKSAATAAATSTTAVVKGQLANITPGVGWGHRDTIKFPSIPRNSPNNI